MSNEILVVTRGDDLASTRSANRAIFEAATKGNLKNTSIMMTCPYIQEAAEMFAGNNEICVGLHATINAEWDAYKWKTVLPQSQVPDLYEDNGNLFSDNSRLNQKKPRIEQIISELDAQLDLATKMGLDLKYADQHMGFEWVVEGLSQEFAAWCHRKGLINPNNILQYFHVDADKLAENYFKKVVEALNDLKEGKYVCAGHPSYYDDETKQLFYEGVSGEMVAKDRDIDRMIFTHPDILRVYGERGIRAVRYDQVF